MFENIRLLTYPHFHLFKIKLNKFLYRMKSQTFSGFISSSVSFVQSEAES